MPRPADPRKQQHWLQHIRRWQRSYLSVRDYCERHHLGEASFYAWKRVLQQRGLLGEGSAADGRAARALFVPVTLGSADSAERCIELVAPDGWVVRVGAGCDALTLQQVLALLREPPC
jgi:hypothetical protein